MAKLDGIDLPRFRKAHEWSRRQLGPFRRRRKQIVDLLAGSRYGEDNLLLSQPIPFLHLLHSVYTRALVSNSPRCLLSTRVPPLKPLAHAMEIALNYEISEMRLDQALRQVVADALISIGILKVGICSSPAEGGEGLLHKVRQPYADCISLDDWVHDMRAKRLDQVGFAGHSFRVPRRALQNDPRYDPAVVQKLGASERYVYDEWGNLRARSLSTDRSTSNEGDHEDMIDLWEIWFPRDQVIAVFAGDMTGGLKTIDPLMVTDYDGPELGPYYLLRFGEIPDNIMPAAPMLDMADAHEALNGVYRKMIRQALRDKTILAVTGSDEDATRIAKTGDGDGARVDGIPPSELRFGGVRNETQQFALHLKQISSYFAGNLDSMAGLSPQAATLGQDRMLSEASSKQIQGMQETTISFAREVMQALSWYWYTDPKRNYAVDVPVNGHPGESVHQPISAQDREGTWLKLNFQIDPYSLQSETPSSKLQGIMQLLQMLMPAAPMMAQQQMGINFAGLLNIFSRYSNNSDIADLIMAAQPIGADEEQQDIPRMPAQTTRTNVRVNRSAATGQGQDSALQLALAGGASSQQQAQMGGVPG